MTETSTPVRRAPRARRTALIGLKLAVSGVLAWWVISRVDIADSAERLGTLDIGWGLAALAAFFVLLAISALRWLVFTRALSLAISPIWAIGVSFIASFLGQVLPAGIGVDAVRVWFLTRRGGRVGVSVASVALDRLTGLATLLLMIAVFLPLLFVRVEDEGARVAITLVLAIGGGGFALLFFLSLLPRYFSRFGPMRALAQTIQLARREGLSPRPGLLSLGLSIVVHLTSVLVVALLAEGIGLDIPTATLLALVPPVMLLATLPISFAGWGVREGAMVAALGYVGVEAGDALALSVLFGFATVVASLPGAIAWLAEGRGLSQLIWRGRETDNGRSAD